MFRTYLPTLNQGFIQRGGGGGGAEIFSPQPQFYPPENLEIEYDYYCGAINISYLILHVTGHKYVSSKCCLNACKHVYIHKHEVVHHSFVD